MKFLVTLWRFSRPHTIIGSFLSITALYILAIRQGGGSPELYMLSLFSALTCNIFITGLNQWSDVDVDRINKPWLPVASGELSKNNALRIVLICAFASFLSAVWLSPAFFLLILVITLIGAAYSLPPLKFKRSHWAAASAIVVVRGLLVNLGFYAHFRYEMTGSGSLDSLIWPLTFFVTAFSLGIAWFKDIPDTAGDAQYEFNTLAVLVGRPAAFYGGVIAVACAYAGVISAAGWGKLPSPGFYSLTHSILLAIFVVQAYRLDVHDNRAVKRFYLFFWGLFFVEYLIYPLGVYF